MKGRINVKKVGFFTESSPIINAYYNEIRNTSVLTREEEIELFKAYKENKCLKARKKIIEANQKFVVSVAKKFNDNTNLLDLINEGNIGLMIAIDAYDYKRGFKFITFAVWYIQREIKAYKLADELITKTNLQKTTFHLDKIKEKFRNENHREITHYEIMEELESQYNIKIIEKSDIYDLSINSIDLPPNGNDFNSDFSPVENDFNSAYYSENTANNLMEEEDNKTLVSEYITILLPREKEIVELSHGINSFSQFTLDDIAEKFSYTTERIRQILKNALEILRIRAKVSEIPDINKYVSPLSKLEIFLLGLHLNKKLNPKDISKITVFSAASIQEALCNSIEVVHNYYLIKKAHA
jgi:RNA polymerase primary sigma factor